MINTLYKQKGSAVWRWKFRLKPKDGRIQDVSLGVSDKQAAEKIRADLLREKQHEFVGLSPAKAIKDAVQRPLLGHVRDFIGDLQAKGRDVQYVAEFESRLCLLMSDCQWKTVQDMTADSLVKWRSAQKKAAKTLNEYLTCAKGFGAWLVSQARIPSNPLASVQKVETRGREKRIRRAFTDAEFEKLLSCAGAQRVVYLFAFLTGIRHGEMKELRWADVDLTAEKASVTVRASVSKNHKQARLPLHSSLLRPLADLRPAGAKDGDPVFAGLMPRSRMFNQHLAAAGIPKLDSEGRIVDFHSLRHTYGTNLFLKGATVREAMELMRHNDARLTTKIYTDTSLLALAGAVEKLHVGPSQGASQKLGATGVNGSSPVAKGHRVKNAVTPSDAGGLATLDDVRRLLSQIGEWCAIQGSNL